MRVRVIGELVTAVGDARRHVGVGVEPVADDEGRHVHVTVREHVEQVVGEAEVAVGVEGEGDPVDFVVGPGTTKRAAEGGVGGGSRARWTAGVGPASPPHVGPRAAPTASVPAARNARRPTTARGGSGGAHAG